MTTIRVRPAAQNPGRMISSKMDIEDFLELTKRTECDCTCVGSTFELTPESKREDFVDVATEIGDRRLNYAKKMEQDDNLVTAANFYLRASACYRVADYGLPGITDEKLTVYHKLVSSFQKYLKLGPDNVSVIDIPFEDKTMEAYYGIPDDCKPDTPVLVFIPGATGFKEENYFIAHYFYDRGIPFIIFDGPGQGVSLYFKQMYLGVDNYVTAVKNVINYVRADDRVGDKVALYGMSYGGFLATQAACALNDDICGVISRGGTDKTDTLTKHPWAGHENFYLNGFLRKFNVDDLETCSKISTAQDITDDLHKITVPLLIIHSHEDPILGVEGAKRIYDLCSSTDKYYADFPGNTHCVNDQNDTASALAADWMGKRMLSR